MPFIDERDHLNGATQMVLAAVSGVADHLLCECRVLARKGNRLRFPWYGAHSAGGAFVLSRCIYMSDHFFTGNVGRVRLKDDERTLLLLAHEVGHLPHAARFRANLYGQLGFIFWAAGIYTLSIFRHGANWHRKAWIEQEAERGRWVLRELLTRSTSPGDLLELLRSNNSANTADWLSTNKALITSLQAEYPGWN